MDQFEEWENYKPTIGDTISEILMMFINWVSEFIPVIVGVVGIILLLIIGIVITSGKHTRQIDGHTYIQLTMYDWDHSPDCWCQKEGK